MKPFRYILVLLCSLAAGNTFAQQDAVYNMYMFNGLYLNPAYAGSSNALNLMAIYHHQWVGVPGSPKTFNISADAPMRRDQYALGLTVSNDNIGLCNALSVTPAFAYRPRIGKVRLSIGIQGSFTWFKVNNENATLADKENLDGTYMTNTSIFIPNIGLGIYVSDLASRRFWAGFSVPHFLPYSLKANKVETYNRNNVARLYNYYLLTGGYVFGKDASVVKVQPSALIMWQKGLPKNIPNFHVNLMLIFFDRAKVGVSYRTGGDEKMFGQSLVGMCEVKATQQLRVGYAYEGNISGLRRVNRGTHEIMLGYEFIKKKNRVVTPRYGRYF